MSKLGADWDFNNLQALIDDRGDVVVWEKAIVDPSQRSDHFASQIEIDDKAGNQPDFRVDNEMGVRYRDATVISGLVTSVDSGRNKRLMESGYAIPGDCVFSPPLTLTGVIGDFDMITMTNPVPVGQGQVIVRGAAKLSDNQRISIDLATNEDKIWYHAACSIWCEDIHGVVYNEGADYVLDGKKIRWIGESPQVGTPYTLKYQAYMEWIAYASPFTRFDQARSLGQRVLLRKKHVAMVNDPLDTVDKRAEDELEFTTRTKI